VASNSHLSLASWNLALNAALDAPCASGFMDIYDSTGTGQPATPNVAVTTQVKLAHLPLSAVAFAAAIAGSKVAAAITAGVGLAVGTATWYRVYEADDTTAVIDGSAGVAADSTDLTLNDKNITVGGTVSVTSWTVGMPIGQ
jgi:hypothetical protein